MGLIDRQGRIQNYLRISVTDRCNLRCVYCVPSKHFKHSPREEILTFEEILFLVGFFYRNFGISKVRLTGGEPLIRRGVKDLIEKIRREFPQVELTITTNGILLKNWVQFLKQNSIRINISLDTLRRERFSLLTGEDKLDDVLSGIHDAKNANLKVKLNTVVLAGINSDELIDLVRFGSSLGFPVRFIEYMPLSGNENWKSLYVPEDEMLKTIQREFTLYPAARDGVARLYKAIPKHNKSADPALIGFISTVSSPFCNTCSRLRITSDGKLVLCLFDSLSYDLKRFLRPTPSEIALFDFLIETVKLKPPGFIAMKDSLNPVGHHIMRRLGG